MTMLQSIIVHATDILRALIGQSNVASHMPFGKGFVKPAVTLKTSSIVDHVTDLIDTYDSQVFPVEHFTQPLGSVSLDDSLSPR